jgi:spermidine/putrescine transport system substrate-binding protein
LRLLVWEGYAPEELRQPFIQKMKEKHGVDLTLDVAYVETNDDFFPALRDNTADVVSPSHQIFKDKRFQLVSLNLLLPLDPARIPAIANLTPELAGADYAKDGGSRYGVPIVQGVYGLAYNASKVPEPKSLRVLLAEEAKGQYSINLDLYEDNVSLFALSAGVPPEKIFTYSEVNTPEIQTHLSKLVANRGTTWSGVERAEDLKGLSYGIVWGSPFAELREMGEDWRFARVEEGFTTWIDNLAINAQVDATPKLRTIAEEWIEYCLGDEFQTYVVRTISNQPTTTTVQAQLTEEERSYLGFLASLKRVTPLPLERADRKGFERLWAEALSAAGVVAAK